MHRLYILGLHSARWSVFEGTADACSARREALWDSKLPFAFAEVDECGRLYDITVASYNDARMEVAYDRHCHQLPKFAEWAP